MAQGLRFTYQVSGGKVFDRMLGLVADQASDMRPAWNEIRGVFHANRRQDFNTEGRHSGSRWKRLSPDYRDRKERLFPGKTILRRTDNLYSSLVSPAHPDAVYRASAKSMAIGTRDPKGRWHQPKRPPIRLNEPEKRAWTGIMHEHVVKSLPKGRGLKRATAFPRRSMGFAAK